MPEHAAPLTLALPVRPDGIPAARWLYSALRAEILDGRLRPGARLPATRELARQYGLSRGIIVAAFEQLRAEGYLTGRTGSGTFVNEVLPDELLQVPRRADPAAPTRPQSPRALSRYAARVQLNTGHDAPSTSAFRANQPALDLFPTTLWAQVAGRRVRRASMRDLVGCGPMGHPQLREAVADYLRSSRGVTCSAEQVAIVSGAQQALDLIARLALDPGDRVCMEDPGYGGAARVFEACGATIVPIPVDVEGMATPDRRQHGARLAYVTPAHQFPLGVAMSLPRRLALLEWARHAGALIVEDDYDSEYRFAGRPLPALQGLDRDGLVLFVGTFGKVLFPSLRLGYLVVPPDLVDAVAVALSTSSRHPPVLEQAVLCDFITEGHFGRHLRRMREVYAERLGVLLDGARRHLDGLLEIAGVEAGLQTAAWLPLGMDGEAATSAAATRGVEVIPLRRFARTPMSRDALQLGFAAVDPPEIRRGVRELAAALEDVGDSTIDPSTTSRVGRAMRRGAGTDTFPRGLLDEVRRDREENAPYMPRAGR